MNSLYETIKFLDSDQPGCRCGLGSLPKRRNFAYLVCWDIICAALEGQRPMQGKKKQGKKL